MNKFKQNLIFLNLISLCFNVYAIAYIGNFPVTLSVCLTAAILVVGIFEVAFHGLRIKTRFTQFILCGILLSALIVGLASATVSGYPINYTSNVLYIFYVVAFLLSTYQIDETCFFEKIRLVIYIYTLCSAYGIYQFIAYLFRLPFQEITWTNHMVSGFNTTNLVKIGGFAFNRAHSIFLEPSFLSKYAVIAIIILLVLYSNSIIQKKQLIFCIIINAVALALSVSGTGLLLLLISGCLYLVRLANDSLDVHSRNRLFITVFAVIIFGWFVFSFANEWVEYIINRIQEIFDPSRSGGMRFTVPYYIMFYSFFAHFLGVGAGNESYIILQYSNEYNAGLSFTTLSSGYAKVGCELGLIGLAALVGLIFTMKRKEKKFSYFFVILIMINFLGGNLLQTDFWAWMFLLHFYKGSEHIELVLNRRRNYGQ